MTKRQIINIVGLAFTLVINGLANALPLNGVTTGNVSDNIPSLFTPAGYVFAIWGMIYFFLIAFAIYQALPAQKENPRLERIGFWFFLSNIFNGTWIFFWHYGLWFLTEVAMLGLLVSLIFLYVRAGIGKSQPKFWERFSIDIPFGIYLGWISVATIANTANLLYVNKLLISSINIQVVLTVAMLVIGAVLGLLMILLRKEVAFPLVLIWAYGGILSKRIDMPAIAITAGIAMTVLAIALLLSIFKLKIVKTKSTLA